MILGTRDLNPSEVRIAQGPPAWAGMWPKVGALVVAGDQVIGGARVLPFADQLVLVDCWAVSDLQGAHWEVLLSRKGVDLYVVQEGIAAACRATLDRFHAGANIAQDYAEARREGVLDALRAVCSPR